MKKYLIEKLKALRQLFDSKTLPSSVELWEKSRKYAYEECALQTFNNEDEIVIARGHYCDGYQRAIKDFVNKKYRGIDE